jgi:hypothetical protein
MHPRPDPPFFYRRVSEVHPEDDRPAVMHMLKNDICRWSLYHRTIHHSLSVVKHTDNSQHTSCYGACIWPCRADPPEKWQVSTHRIDAKLKHAIGRIANLTDWDALHYKYGVQVKVQGRVGFPHRQGNSARLAFALTNPVYSWHQSGCRQASQT